VVFVVSCLVLASVPLLLLDQMHWPLLILLEGVLVGLACWLNRAYRSYILLFLVACLLFFIGGEVFLRVRYFGLNGLSFDRCRPASYGHPWSAMQFSEATYTGLKPNTVMWFKGRRFSVNADGFRGKTYTRPKPEGVYRVILLGASATQGSGLGDTEVVTDVLEQMLNSTGLPTRVEVVNLSIGGSRAGEMLDCLQNVGMSYQPDLILFCANQTLIPAKTLDIKPRKVHAVDVPFWRKVMDKHYSFLSERFFFVVLLEQFRSGDINRMGQALRAPTESKARSVEEGQKNNLETSLKIIHETAGPIPVMLYLLRPISNLSQMNDRQAYRDYLKLRAADFSMSVLDTYTLDLRAYTEMDLIVYPGDKHPNAIIQRLYAEKMAETVVPFIRQALSNR
jgi:hypothetical protein